MLEAQATVPTILPTHITPLNNPNCGHILLSAPDLNQRHHHSPLYKAANANETICTTRGQQTRGKTRIEGDRQKHKNSPWQNNQQRAALTANEPPPKFDSCSWTGDRFAEALQVWYQLIMMRMILAESCHSGGSVNVLLWRAAVRWQAISHASNAVSQGSGQRGSLLP
jgi:hypothetical protein